FLSPRETAFAQPESYCHRYASLSDEEAVATAERIWDAINAPNLEQNILPTRGRATLVLRKGPDHAVERVRLRKLSGALRTPRRPGPASAAPRRPAPPCP